MFVLFSFFQIEKASRTVNDRPNALNSTDASHIGWMFLRPDSLRRSPKATQNETKPGLVSCGARAVGRSPAIPTRPFQRAHSNAPFQRAFARRDQTRSPSRIHHSIPETKTMHAVGEWVSRPGSNPGAQRVRFPRGVPVFLDSKKRWGRMFHRGDAALQAACGGCKPRRLHHFSSKE